jgi:GNAT superfamily N-acetyltransferase
VILDGVRVTDEWGERETGGNLSHIRTLALDVWCIFRGQGAKAAVAFLRGFAQRRLYATTERLIMSKELAAAGAPSRVRVEQAGPEHLPALAAFNRRQCDTRRTPLFERSLAQGEHALIGFVEDELIGYMWWLDATQAATGFGLTPFGIALEDHEVYGHNLFIAPEHRGGGIAAEFLAGIESEFARLGFQRMLGYVERANRPARWLYLTSGYRLVRGCKTRTVLGRVMLVDGKAYVSGRQRLGPLIRMVLARVRH